MRGSAGPTWTWRAVVVGEGTRYWSGNLFSLIAPRFAAHGAELWVPELGGRTDPRNPSHELLMGILGGMSESERQHVIMVDDHYALPCNGPLDGRLVDAPGSRPQHRVMWC